MGHAARMGEDNRKLKTLICKYEGKCLLEDLAVDGRNVLRGCPGRWSEAVEGISCGIRG